MIWLVKNHLWLELYGSHSAKTIRLYLDLIVRLLGIGGLRPAFFFVLAIFTHDEEDRAGDDKHQCARENLSHGSSPLSIFKLCVGRLAGAQSSPKGIPLKVMSEPSNHACKSISSTSINPCAANPRG